ncbi:MAG: hypothetical protein Ct9H300mP23_05670 [Nitrospinota bacterium]|nr:MAG: hypothetical protein Ct9H300mP23_05670 [Nitrospinota bacterium]
MNKGKIIQVMGPVVDVSFEDGVLPALYNAIHVERAGEKGEKETLVCEVALHLGDNAVRSVAYAFNRWLGSWNGSNRYRCSYHCSSRRRSTRADS